VPQVREKEILVYNLSPEERVFDRRQDRAVHSTVQPLQPSNYNLKKITLDKTPERPEP
jgi:hypothetical protein